jgi:hypothetical protein
MPGSYDLIGLSAVSGRQRRDGGLFLEAPLHLFWIPCVPSYTKLEHVNAKRCEREHDRYCGFGALIWRGPVVRIPRPSNSAQSSPYNGLSFLFGKKMEILTLFSQGYVRLVRNEWTKAAERNSINLGLDEYTPSYSTTKLRITVSCKERLYRELTRVELKLHLIRTDFLLLIQGTPYPAARQGPLTACTTTYGVHQSQRRNTCLDAVLAYMHPGTAAPPVCSRLEPLFNDGYKLTSLFFRCDRDRWWVCWWGT